MMEDLITDEAKRFKAFRLAENMTQKELGEVIGKTTSWVNKVELGTRRIGIEEVRLLHDKMSMSYEWFYNGQGKRIADKKDENLLKVTSELRNDLELLRQKLDKQDQLIKKLVRDLYAQKD